MVGRHPFEEDRNAFSLPVTAKASALVQAGRVRPDDEREGVWWVGTTTEDKEAYRVEVCESFCSCTCRYGRHMGGDPTCSHVLAAIMEAEVAESGVVREVGVDA